MTAAPAGMGGAHQTVNRHSGIICCVCFLYERPLPLPLGEVAERSEDGEGKPGCNALSVTCGDSSPGGRAKGQYQSSGADVLRQGQRKATISLDFSKKTNTMDTYCFP